MRTSSPQPSPPRRRGGEGEKSERRESPPRSRALRTPTSRSRALRKPTLEVARSESASPPRPRGGEGWVRRPATSVADRRCLQRGAAVLHVDREADGAALVLGHERVLVAAQL